MREREREEKKIFYFLFSLGFPCAQAGPTAATASLVCTEQLSTRENCWYRGLIERKWYWKTRDVGEVDGGGGALPFIFFRLYLDTNTERSVAGAGGHCAGCWSPCEPRRPVQKRGTWGDCARRNEALLLLAALGWFLLLFKKRTDLHWWPRGTHVLLPSYSRAIPPPSTTTKKKRCKKA